MTAKNVQMAKGKIHDHFDTAKLNFMQSCKLAPDAVVASASFECFMDKPHAEKCQFDLHYIFQKQFFQNIQLLVLQKTIFEKFKTPLLTRPPCYLSFCNTPYCANEMNQDQNKKWKQSLHIHRSDCNLPLMFFKNYKNL